MNMDQLFKEKRILVVVAHPDDELLGPGGSLNQWSAQPDTRIRVVILGEGITSRSDQRDTEAWKAELEAHKADIRKAKACIGYHELSTYDFPDNRFDGVDLLDLVKAVEKEKADFQPEVVLTHHGQDLNIDHRCTYNAVLTACRPLEAEGVRSILTFETPSSTEWQAPDQEAFRPNVFVRLAESALDAKIRGMESYGYEKRSFPHPRSPESLRTISRRWASVIGAEYAEAFQLIRHIQ